MPKPKNKKRKFIDPKRERTTTFKLIHRSQRDPLAADDEAPQRLLQPINVGQNKEKLEKQKEKEREYGVFFDDEYDYLQHLKDRSAADADWSELDRFLLERPKDPVVEIKLPEAVFASKEEEDVGLLNKAAPRSGPRPDLDPDIVAALDDDFDFDDPENQLEDDFVLLANASGSEKESEDDDDDDGSYLSEEEEDDEVPSLDGRFSFEEEETRSRFTNYSMSSSVIKRNEGLSLLDDRFEQFFEEYDDENVGALECDEIEGVRPENSEIMEQTIMEFERKKAEERQKPEFDNSLALIASESEDGDDLGPLERVTIEYEEKWDCQSILSTYSNLYNHPKLITERRPDPIKISGKTGMPKDVLGKGLTAAALKKLNLQNGMNEKKEDETVTLASRISALSFRSKHETAEEKRARKLGMKEYKRERRIERKANRDAFKEEKNRQEKILLNKKNLQGRKLI